MPTPLLLPGPCYHVYNRGVARTTLFHTDAHYRRFAALLEHHVAPCARIYAFALLPNHFHLVLAPHADGPRSASQALSNACNAYAKAFNLRTGRVGALFCRPFQRKPIESEAYAAAAVRYVLHNAVRHGLVDEVAAWPWSSWHLRQALPDAALSAGVWRWLAEDPSFYGWDGFPDEVAPAT